jgi:hypothetical protein
MITLTKALVGTIVTGAMAVSAAVPAFAGDGFGGRGGHGWRGGNPRHAVEMCSRIAEREASRQSYGRANVTDIRDVRDVRWGYEVRGRIAVRSFGRDSHGRGYDRGWSRGWDHSSHDFDTGSFKCRVEGGRVAYLDFNGIRGL